MIENLDELIEAIADQTREHIAREIAKVRAEHAIEVAELKAKLSESITREDVTAEVTRQVAAIPPAKNGENAEVDYGRVSELVKAAVAALPPAKPGEPGKDATVDYDKICDKVGDVIVLAVAKEVAKIPAPKNGDPGKDAAVDYAIVKEFATAAAVTAVAAIPKPADGKPVDPEVVRAMVDAEVDRRISALPKPEKAPEIDYTNIWRGCSDLIKQHIGGLPTFATPEYVDASVTKALNALPPPVVLPDIPAEVARAVAAEFAALPSIPEAVAHAVAAIPRVKGDPGRDFDPELLRAEVARAVSALPPPKPGDPGKDAEPIHPDTVRVMMLEIAEDLIAKGFAALPPAKDGESIDPRDVRRMVDEEVERQLVAVVPLIKGEPGVPGVSPDSLELDYADDSGELAVRFVAGERVIEKKVALPIVRDAGVHVRGRFYRKGQVVTYGGSGFVATRDTDDPIGTDPPSTAWRLLVKRGRDGKPE